jgi:hypothetical protein
MAKRRQVADQQIPQEAPAKTVEARENQMIHAAVELAAKRLADGTATDQVVLFYLKLGSTREVLEKERIVNENLLSLAKVEAIKSGKRTEELFAEAIEAVRSYNGTPESTDDQT